jgi:glycosyltransferase involved in cell wall biosynthesis
LISIIVPVYNEEPNLVPLHGEIAAALDSTGRDYEIVYVDDGSNDGSFERLKALAAACPAVTVVRFRRNFGQTAALAAGIDAAVGDILIFMDADLQNDPADIPQLLQKLEEGYDVVSGWRRNRKDKTLTRKIPSNMANWLISQVTGVHLNDYGCTLKAYRREVLQNFKLYGEMHRFIPAYAFWAGAAITELPVNHRPRRAGKSKYGLSRILKVLLDLTTVKFLGAFATKPIYVFGTAGFAAMFMGILAALIVLYQKFVDGVYAYRNPVLLLGVFLFVVGMQFVMLGLLAELIIRTYHESQNKTTYVVRQILKGHSAANGATQPPLEVASPIGQG